MNTHSTCQMQSNKQNKTHNEPAIELGVQERVETQAHGAELHMGQSCTMQIPAVFAEAEVGAKAKAGRGWQRPAGIGETSVQCARCCTKEVMYITGRHSPC